MFNPTLKIRKTILFFLIVIINELIDFGVDIRLDTCSKGR